MFAPPVAKAKTQAVAMSNNNDAHQRSMFAAPPTGRTAAVEAPALPRTIGNQATLRFLSRAGSSATATQKVLQPKLVVGQVNDPLESEADHVADQVMLMSGPKLSAAGARPQLSRKCTACEDEENKKVQTKQAGTSTAGGEAPGIVHNVLSSPGRPLDPATRAFMEPRFGHDFSDVRIHPDATAGESARAVNALAYTVERDVVFAPGQYAPDSDQGRRLLAHELAHVVQQSDRGSGASLPGSKNVVQRYGHAHSCESPDRLGPYIWPGHAQAKVCVQAAIDATDGRPLTADVSRNLLVFFGKDSAIATNLAKINANFKTIGGALDAQYLYHCSKKGDSSDSNALECKGQNAETSHSGNKDITLCFDNLSNWSVPWAAWLIIHENVHRGLDVWGHSWEAGSIDKCIFNNGALSASQLDLANADSYACFAILQCTKGASPDDGPDGGKQLQRSAKTSGGASGVPPVVNRVLNSAGQPLDSFARTFFEPRFGHDFSKVRVHTGTLAATSAQAVDARAYTVGSHLVFDANEYAPGTTAGLKLLAHELTHVVQQSPSEASQAQPERISNPFDESEVAAEREAERVLSSPSVQPVPMTHRPAGTLPVATLQRYKVPDNLRCKDVAGWLNANSPYAPEWAQTACDYSFNGQLDVSAPRKSRGGVSVTARGNRGLAVSVTCPTDLPEWSPTGREGRTKQLLAWLKMIAVLDKHEGRHRKIGQDWRATLEANFRAVNTKVTGADEADATAKLTLKVTDDRQKWTNDAQKAQSKIDPFRDAILDCPAETGMEELMPQPNNVGQGMPPPQPMKLGAPPAPVQPKPLSPELQKLFPSGS